MGRYWRSSGPSSRAISGPGPPLILAVVVTAFATEAALVLSATMSCLMLLSNCRTLIDQAREDFTA